MSDTFRQKYRELTPEEAARVERIKDLAGLLEKEIIGPHPARGYETLIGRYESLAMTNLELAVMWAVKGVTS